MQSHILRHYYILPVDSLYGQAENTLMAFDGIPSIRGAFSVDNLSMALLSSSAIGNAFSSSMTDRRATVSIVSSEILLYLEYRSWRIKLTTALIMVCESSELSSYSRTRQLIEFKRYLFENVSKFFYERIIYNLICCSRSV